MINIFSGIISRFDFRKSYEKKRLQSLRDRWGYKSERIRNFDLISNYHKLVSGSSAGGFVDEKTWSDLSFDSVYSILDRNLSGPGRQYLYHILRKYENDEEVLNKRYDLIHLFKQNPEIREKIQLGLLRLSSDDTYFIISLLLGESPIIPKYPFLIYFSSLLSLSVMMAWFTISSSFFFAVLFMSVLNLVITKIYSSKIYESFIGFVNLNKLISATYELSKIQTDIPIEQLSVLKKHSWLLKDLNKKVGYLVFEKSSLDTMAQAVIEYFNMFCLFDLVAYTRSVIKLYKHKKELLEAYDAVASLDASISIASYLEGVPFYSKPFFTDENNISFKEVYHPLIQGAVPNTINCLKKSALITGSNMAGKTTFIKCIGVNIILAQTLNITLARKAVIPKLIVKSSIKIEDKIEDSKSYYFTEVEEIQKLIGLSRSNKKYLFVIDEIFRGTNTVERLGASTAVLRQLNQNNIVLVTTHDIELQELLNNSFAIYHFNEQVEGNLYYFDYKIKEGPCSSGNAIKLLELKGYPESITNEAKRISKDFIKSSS